MREKNLGFFFPFRQRDVRFTLGPPTSTFCHSNSPRDLLSGKFSPEGHMRLPLYKSLVVALPFILSTPAIPQSGPVNAMAQIIVGLQTGNMNWNRFYPNVRQVIYMQTGGSGMYPQLAQLGPVQNVVLVGGMQLPLGWIYNFRSFFPAGAVDWQVASDNAGNVLQLAFQPSQRSIPTSLPSRPQPSARPDDSEEPDDPPPPVKAAPVSKGGTGTVTASTKGEACRLFPDLC